VSTAVGPIIIIIIIVEDWMGLKGPKLDDMMMKINSEKVKYIPVSRLGNVS
jgi:hypothetical protein